MLTPTQLDNLPNPILELYRAYEESIILDIARRLGKADMTEGAAWQMQRLTESGLIYDNALEELSRITGQSEDTLRQLFEQYGVKAMAFDDALYRAAGLNPLPLNLSPAMIAVLKIGLQKTNNLMHNLTLTTAITGQDAFINAADLAYMQVTTGSMSYLQAIRAAVKQVARDGLSVIAFSGRIDQLDVAMRRTVLTGVAQTVGQLQIARADEMGQDLVAVSAHAGARNHGEGPMNHESWQGRVYSRARHTEYADFVETTGYGSIVGLCGVNCRHSFYPFFEGLSENAYQQATLDEFAERTVKYNGKEYSFYDATQLQRRFEREIRQAKREAAAVEAAGLDATDEQRGVKAIQAQLRDFIKQTGLVRQPPREQI